jgi:hypothetical protein
VKVDRNISQERTPDPPGAVLRPTEKPSAPAGAVDTEPSTAGERHVDFDLWLHRATVLLFVFVCAVVGVLLMILPWRPEWTDNRLLLAFPGLRTFVANGFVRGLCTGLGLLDTWIGFWDAIHYHEGRRP